MTNEELEKITMRTDIEYDYLRDKVHEQYEEIKRLNELMDELEDFIRDEYRNPSEQDLEWEIGLILDKLVELRRED